jgi:hypothetical protein
MSALHPVTGKPLHFGRNRPAPRPKRMMSKYLTSGAALPTAPSVVDYFTGVSGLSDVLANDELGDCTSAGALHLTESITSAAGSPVVFTRNDAVGFYSLSTGYVPGDSTTDQGGDEVTILNTWRAKGLDGNGAHAIAGWIDVDPTNVPLMRSIIWLFGGLYFGLELPDAWMASPPTGDGFIWTPAEPNPDQGHCVVGLGANDEGVQIDTWGLIGTITWDAIASLCVAAAGGTLYAVITKDCLAKATQLAPSGVDWACLVAEFNSEGGRVRV